ncbi:type IV toxin-antitoxin system AbiEi family antitoxin domain-containing protein [Williamsia sp.]|uniref:type IV toxin-antitoxin system AbiEi family antitoxin domain-containing protein n=1 Tax=Williamsia sp. TaxID=1872085 RepID=UPI002F94B5D9
MSEPTIEDPNLVRRRDALQIGELDRQLATRVKAGQLRRLYRGFYTFTSDLEQLDTYAREQEIYRRQVLAAADNGEQDKAISHWSAAALHGLPLLDG